MNFGILNRDLKLPMLEAKDLAMLLMHRKLNVKNEDEVIDALLCWL